MHAEMAIAGEAFGQILDMVVHEQKLEHDGYVRSAIHPSAVASVAVGESVGKAVGASVWLKSNFTQPFPLADLV